MATANPVSDVLAAKADAADDSPFWEDIDISKEECRILKGLRGEQEKLAEEKKILEATREEVNAAKIRAEEKISELEKVEASIQALLDKLERGKSKKIKRLASVYNGMKPEQTAKIIAKMDMASTVEILSNMDEKKVGKVLSYVSPELAMKISRALTSP
ncbi:MAG: MotE family protein [Mariprofundaceae bacterium]